MVTLRSPRVALTFVIASLLPHFAVFCIVCLRTSIGLLTHFTMADLQVNKEAAQRFIAGALGDTSGESSKRDSPGSKEDSGRKKKKKKSS